MTKDHVLHIGDYIPGDGSSHDAGILSVVHSNGTVEVLEEVYSDDGLIGEVIGHNKTSMSVYDLRRILGVSHLFYDGEQLI